MSDPVKNFKHVKNTPVSREVQNGIGRFRLLNFLPGFADLSRGFTKTARDWAPPRGEVMI